MKNILSLYQVFELWFKLVLTELKEVHKMMSSEHIDERSMPIIVHHLKRFCCLQSHVATMESCKTLTPQDFLSFRDRLGISSGFESWQLRQIEIILGLEQQQRDAGMDPLEHMEKLANEGKISSVVLAEFNSVIESPSLYELLKKWLCRTPVNGSFLGDDDDDAVISSYVNSHLAAMNSHSEMVISHFESIGHGDESTLGGAP